MWVGSYWVRLRSPSYPPLYSERYRLGCWVIPLGFGWRIVFRRKSS